MTEDFKTDIISKVLAGLGTAFYGIVLLGQTIKDKFMIALNSADLSEAYINNNTQEHLIYENPKKESLQITLRWPIVIKTSQEEDTNDTTIDVTKDTNNIQLNLF